MKRVKTGEIDADAFQAEIPAAFQELLENPTINRPFIDQAGSDALEMLDSVIININRANTWASMARWLAFAAMLTGITSGGMMIAESVLEKASQNQWEKTPAFNNFADRSISRYSFDGLSNLRVQRAALADPMQLGFTAPS